MPSTAREVIRLSALRLGVTLPPASPTISTITARELIRLAALRIGVTPPPVSVTNSAETVLQVLTQAMSDIGVIGEAETPNAEQGVDGLTAIQQMLNAWAIDGVNYGLTALTLSSALAVPISHVSAVRSNLAVALAAQYGVALPPTVAQAAAAGYAFVRAYFRENEALSVLQQMLDSWVVDGIDYGLTGLVITDAISVPIQHVDALRSNLAVALCPMHGIEPPAAVLQAAQTGYAYLRSYFRANEGLVMLQELLAEIEGDGIRHGAEVATLTATLNLPDNHTGPIRAMLAPRLAPLFGVQTPPEVMMAAENAKRILQAMYCVPPQLRADREHWRRTPTNADVIIGPSTFDDPYIRLE